MVELSILDLARVAGNTTPRMALDNARALAGLAESCGYRRFWVAEHHNMRGIASAATSLLVAHIAAGTKTIRVGAGGIMLPNHAPLIVAEQFGTLAHLFPGRIDLGLGRAPGTDQATLRALRRTAMSAENFPQDVLELQAYFSKEAAGFSVQAVPAAGTEVPLWILGSSTFGASLAAEFGLPYAFASHFAPDQLMTAIQVYRNRFEPSPECPKPYVMVGVNIIAADTTAHAQFLSSTQKMSFTDLLRGSTRFSKPPIENINDYWNEREEMRVRQMLSCSIIGDTAQVRDGIHALVEQTGADELMVVSDIYDFKERQRSIHLIAESIGKVPAFV